MILSRHPATISCAGVPSEAQEQPPASMAESLLLTGYIFLANFLPTTHTATSAYPLMGKLTYIHRSPSINSCNNRFGYF